MALPPKTWFWMAAGFSPNSSPHMEDDSLPDLGVSSSMAVGWVAVPECCVLGPRC